MFRITEDPSYGSLVYSTVDMDLVHDNGQTEYAAITPTLSLSTDTIESFL